MPHSKPPARVGSGRSSRIGGSPPLVSSRTSDPACGRSSPRPAGSVRRVAVCTCGPARAASSNARVIRIIRSIGADCVHADSLRLRGCMTPTAYADRSEEGTVKDPRALRKAPMPRPVPQVVQISGSLRASLLVPGDGRGDRGPEEHQAALRCERSADGDLGRDHAAVPQTRWACRERSRSMKHSTTSLYGQPTKSSSVRRLFPATGSRSVISS